MNPIAIGFIATGIVLLLFGISSFRKNKRTKGWIFSITGLFAIVTLFADSFFLAR